MKKMLTLLLTLVFALSLAACGSSAKTPEESAAPVEVPKESAEVVGMANPWTEYASLEEAEAAAGFKFPQPKWDVAYDSVTYRVMDGIIEIIYAQDDGQVMTLRKGADETDISGDYNDYNFTSCFDGETISGKIQGMTNEQGEQLCKTATWVSDGHFYVIFVELSETMETMMETIQLINDAQG